MRKKVSVVIPCFNSESYIEETVESVLSQTYRDMELICVDDGSMDGTRNILRGYGDRIRVLVHPEGKNRGEYASYNLGIRNSYGSFIALLDHDDLWVPQKTEIQVRYLEEHEDVDLVYSNAYLIDSTGQVTGQHLSDDHRETNDPDVLILKNYVAPSGAMIRRRVFDRVGVFNERYLGGDHDFFARVSESGTLGYLGNRLFSRRIHPGQTSRNRRLREEAFQILADACARYGYSRKSVRKRKASIHYGLGEHDYRNRRWMSAFYHFSFAAYYDFAKGIRGKRVWLDLLFQRSGQPNLIRDSIHED